jgi:retron-type reverse transcriptase
VGRKTVNNQTMIKLELAKWGYTYSKEHFVNLWPTLIKQRATINLRYNAKYSSRKSGMCNCNQFIF